MQCERNGGQPQIRGQRGGRGEKKKRGRECSAGIQATCSFEHALMILNREYQRYQSQKTWLVTFGKPGVDDELVAVTSTGGPRRELDWSTNEITGQTNQ